MKSKIAIFASGNGTNAQRLIQYFKDHPSIAVDSVLCNRKEAGVLQLAKELDVDSFYFPKQEFESAEPIIDLLKERSVEWIVLAGFLLKISSKLIHHAADHIINIHPALLPKFGGKGMYGDHVHRAVLSNGEKESGISIHMVDQDYDTGAIIAQFSCAIDNAETVESLRKKIQNLEHEHLPKVVERIIIESKKE